MTATRALIATVLLIASALGARPASAQTPAAPASAAPQPVEWITRAIKAPRVSFQTFDSAAAKTKVSYHLYTPAAYEREPERRFPVVYWLHGSGGGLGGIASVAQRFDDAIEASKTPPCLVVFVNGLEMGMYVDWSNGAAPVETVIVRDVVSHIDATFRTIPTREGRLLDGYSMGGYGAARFGFKFPEMFRAVSIMGAGPMQETLTRAPRASKVQAEELMARVYGGSQAKFLEASPRTLAKANADTIARGSLVRMVIGDKDETYENNAAFHRHLESLKIPHEWIVLKGIEHDPQGVLEALGDDNWAFYRKAFGDKPKTGEAPKPAVAPTTVAPAKSADGSIKFRVKGVERNAIFVNAPTDGSKRPAVIALHGGMGTAERMRAGSGFDAVARANDFMVVYAEGTAFGAGRHAWNTGHLLRRQVRDADDIAYFDTLIDTIISDHGADPTRIYMTGASNGGMMTFVYAVARAERLAAIAPVVASMFTFDKTPSVPLPVLIVNGAKDDEVPIEGGMSKNPLVSGAQSTPYKPLTDVVAFWVRANKSKPEATTRAAGTVTTSTYAAGDGGAVTEFVVDSAGGHGWPGTPARRGVNAPIASFKGAELVWEFFKDKTRDKTRATTRAKTPDNTRTAKPAASSPKP